MHIVKGYWWINPNIKVSGNPQKKRATLWKIPNSDNNDVDNHSDDNNNSNDQHDRNKLVPLATLENEGIKK
jgi:hypothetical protein